MILRRLSQSLREQNWTAIWIEFVLLVVGVFLGIQVSNWNEARVERERTNKVMDAFRADMRDYIEVQQSFGGQVSKGLSAFDAARARGEKPPPYVLRVRGSQTPPTSVWQVAQQSGLAELVHPTLMFDLGFFYSELDGIGLNFVRYSEFVEREILPRVADPQAFYDEKGNLNPAYQQNMLRLREWATDGAVEVVSAKCLLKRFERPKDAGPSCRPDYGSFDSEGETP